MPAEVADGLFALAQIDTCLRIAGAVIFACGLIMVGIYLFTKR